MSGLFREKKAYNRLRDRFEPALEEVWPHVFKGEECLKVSMEKKNLERLMLTSYRLMKHIRVFLKKSKLDYTEHNSYPTIYNALEKAATIFTYRDNKCTLAVEASVLEALSRACYRLMKTYGMISVSSSAKSQWWCQCCKKNIASDDGLCSQCSGIDDAPRNTVSGPFFIADKDFPLPGSDMMFSNYRNPLR